MSEVRSEQTAENKQDTTAADELAATQQAFDALHLPDGFSRRRLTEADAANYLAFDDFIFFEGNPETPKNHEPEHFTLDLITEAMNKGGIFEGIFDNQGNLVAAMWLAVKPEESELEIANLGVRPEYRDKKMGSYFLNAAEVIARAREMDNLGLHVDPLNERGMYLYFKQGFRVTSYEHSPESGLEDWLVMSRKLDGWNDEMSADQLEVRAGDEAGLDKALADGYVGVDYKDVADKNDPADNTVIFVKPIYTAN